MANVLIGAPIYSDVGVLYTPTFSGGSWSAGNPLTNLAKRQLHKVARSASAAEADTRVTADLKADRAVRVVAIPKHTLSTAAQWRVTGRPSSLLFGYVAGEDVTALGGTFSRSGTATFVDRAGVVRTAADGVLRDGHWIDGVRTVLLEPARTNICIRSEEFDTWGLSVGATVTANDAVAPDGATTADRLNTAGGVSSENVYRAITYTGDGTKSIAIYLKAGTGAITDISARDTTAATHRHLVRVTWTAGVPSLSSITGSGTLFPVEALGTSGWYRILFTADNVVAANANTMIIYPTGTTTASGTVYAWGAQAEDATIPSSYIPTAASTVTRNTDSLYFPFTAAPQELTAYVKGVNLGVYVPDSTNYRVLHIGAANLATDARFGMGKNTSNQHFAQYDDGTTEVASQGAFGATAAYGDTIEHRAILSSTWTARSGGALNGGTEALASASSASGSAVSWAAGVNRLYLAGAFSSNNAPFAYEQIAVLAGTQSMDTMRAAIHDSGWLDAWPSGWDAETAENLNVPLVHILSSDFTARYWTVQVSDPDNADGSVDLARLAVTGGYQPTYNFSYGARVHLESETARVRSDGGATIYDERPARRVAKFAVELLPENEAWVSAWRTMRRLGSVGQCVLVLDPDATDAVMAESAFLAVPREMGALEYPQATYRTVPFAFEEEL